MRGLSGAYADKHSGILPLEDGAVGLSRMPRFGGQTVIRWSVAEHLLAGMTWARRHRPGWTAFELAFACHDYHESHTADTPTSFKTWDQRRLQHKLDVRLYNYLGLSPRRYLHDLEAPVKLLDRDMLLAEASLVCPPLTYETIQQELGGRSASHSCRVAVGEVLGTVGPGDNAVAAEWLKRVRELLQGVRHED